MGKRSSYELRPRDKYFTPEAAVLPLKNVLPKHFSYCEPCAGDGRLVSHLSKHLEAVCFLAMDIEPDAEWIIEGDALHLSSDDVEYSQYIVTNPPYTWNVLKPLLENWVELRPTVLLMPADFMHNKRVKPFMEQCAWVQSVGRVRWIEGSKTSGVDNYAWYCFDKNKKWDQPTSFYGRVL